MGVRFEITHRIETWNQDFHPVSEYNHCFQQANVTHLSEGRVLTVRMWHWQSSSLSRKWYGSFPAEIWNYAKIQRPLRIWGRKRCQKGAIRTCPIRCLILILHFTEVFFRNHLIADPDWTNSIIRWPREVSDLSRETWFTPTVWETMDREIISQDVFSRIEPSPGAVSSPPESGCAPTHLRVLN